MYVCACVRVRVPRKSACVSMYLNIFEDGFIVFKYGLPLLTGGFE